MATETLAVTRGQNGRFTSTVRTSTLTQSAGTDLYTSEDVQATVNQIVHESDEVSEANFEGVRGLIQGEPLRRTRYATNKALALGAKLDETFEDTYVAGVMFGLYLAGHQDSIPTV